MAHAELPESMDEPYPQFGPRRHRVDDKLTLIYRSDQTLHLVLTRLRAGIAQRCTGSTADTYTRSFQQFEAYLLEQHAAWDDPPKVLRHRANRFIQERGGIVRHQDDHIVVHPPVNNGVSAQTLRLQFEALRSLYEEAIRQKLYPYQINPFERDIKPKQSYRTAPTPPSSSGLSQFDAWRLEVNRYFVFSDKKWIPALLTDSLTLYQRIDEVFTRSNASLRDRCLLHILFQGGPRVSEASRLCFKGWSITMTSQPGFSESFLLRNKGSGDQPVKPVHVDRSTGELIRLYFMTERREVDPWDSEFSDWCRSKNISEGQPEDYFKFLIHKKLPPESIQVFLNNRGAGYSANAFRKGVWRPLLAAAGIYARPHHARHAFVTQFMRAIDESYSDHPEMRRQLRQSLGSYMFWKRPDLMLGSYDHSQTSQQVFDRLSQIKTTIALSEQLKNQQKDVAKSKGDSPQLSDQALELLSIQKKGEYNREN